MTDSLETIERKIEKEREAPHPNHPALQRLYLAREKAQEREFKKSIAARNRRKP